MKVEVTGGEERRGERERTFERSVGVLSQVNLVEVGVSAYAQLRCSSISVFGEVVRVVPSSLPNLGMSSPKEYGIRGRWVSGRVRGYEQWGQL